MWRTVKLGDVCGFQNGRAFRKSEWAEDGLPIVRIQNLQDRKTAFNYFAGNYESKIFIEEGDLILGWSGTIRPFIWNSGPALINQHVFKVDTSNDVSTKFIFYSLTEATKRLSGGMVGIGLKHITKKTLNQTKILLPPLAEQKRIVERLDKAFAEIDKAQNANAKNERQLMVVLENAVAKLLITPKSTSELTELSEFLDETITGPFGSSLHKSDYTDNGVAVINPQNILNGEISTSNCNFISYEKAKDLSRYSLQVGDIVLGRRGEMGRCAVVDASEKKMICGTGCMILRAKSGCSPYYLAELIRSKYIRSVLEKNSIGMTMANLNQKILLNVKIPRDSYRNQIERVNTCRRLREFVDSAITVRKNKANKLTDIRRSILKQELTPSEAV